MQATCKICGATGGQETFYQSSLSRCKQCINRINKERYHQRYKHELRATRRAKDFQKKTVVVDIPETDRAYAAGIIDGEGCIRMTNRGRNGGTTFRSGQYTLMVEVTNTSKAMIDWLAQRFGGSVCFIQASVDENRKERWHWRVAANKALCVLDAIWPYVLVKRTQAKLGRRFQRYVQYPGRAVTPKVHALHERFYQELRALNKRGVR